MDVVFLGAIAGEGGKGYTISCEVNLFLGAIDGGGGKGERLMGGYQVKYKGRCRCEPV